MQQTDQCWHFEGLLKIIVSAKFGGFDGGLNGPVGGHEHHREPGLSVVNLPDELQAAKAWQTQIRQDDIAFFVAGAAKPFVSAMADNDREAIFIEDIAQVSSKAGVVFNA